MTEIFIEEKGRIPLLLLLIIILILAGVILWGVIVRLRTPAGKGFVDLPDRIQVVWAMYESARRGDINTYIDCFAPESQSSIQDTLKSMGEEAFREYLRNKANGVLGVSIYSLQGNDQNTIGTAGSGNKEASASSSGFDEDIITFPVEIVYQGRNEFQVFTLRRQGNTWKILSVSLPTLSPQPIPYGLNVNQ
ncbi:MAG: hypothetical protein ACMUIM_06025 [bacterium]